MPKVLALKELCLQQINQLISHAVAVLSKFLQHAGNCCLRLSALSYAPHLHCGMKMMSVLSVFKCTNPFSNKTIRGRIPHIMDCSSHLLIKGISLSFWILLQH
jgi:hypothetical protein